MSSRIKANNYYKDTKEAGIRFVRRPKKTVVVMLDPEDIKCEVTNIDFLESFLSLPLNDLGDQYL